MTQKDAFKQVRTLGLVIHQTFDAEYRVAPQLRESSVSADRNVQTVAQERKAYYTNDLDDAVGTARAMAKQMAERRVRAAFASPVGAYCTVSIAKEAK